MYLKEENSIELFYYYSLTLSMVIDLFKLLFIIVMYFVTETYITKEDIIFFVLIVKSDCTDANQLS